MLEGGLEGGVLRELYADSNGITSLSPYLERLSQDSPLWHLSVRGCPLTDLIENLGRVSIPSFLYTFNKTKMIDIVRDLSIGVSDRETEERLVERAQSFLSEKRREIILKNIRVLNTTPYENLTESARQKLGLKEGHYNLLARITFSIPHTSSKEWIQENVSMLYAFLHEGERGYY